MARKRGKMALYEVMSKVQARSEQNRAVEPLKPKKETEHVPVSKVEEIDVPEPQAAVNWRKKPRIIQYNLGRIEFSIPYQLAITAGLGLILLLLLTFRFGQFSAGGSRQPVSRSAGSSPGSSRTDLPGLSSSGSTRTTMPDSSRSMAPVSHENMPALGDPDGTNVIVLAEYYSQTQLEPVKDYFDSKGILTEIVPFGSKYQLRTIDKFRDNPSNPGTKGNELIKRIEEIGKGYKAPQGFETFAPNKFDDAYGKKVEN